MQRVDTQIFHKDLGNYVSTMRNDAELTDFLVGNYKLAINRFYRTESCNIRKIIGTDIDSASRSLLMEHKDKIVGASDDPGYQELMIYFYKALEWNSDEVMASGWTSHIRQHLSKSGISSEAYYEFFRAIIPSSSD